MCGIVGIIGAQNWYNSDECMKHLLVVDTLRGPHSTGLFWVTNKDKCEYYKTLDNGATFAMSETFKQFVTWGKGTKFYCGHNRWATVGNVDKSNAHPFSHNGVTGVHNGTLRAYTGLDKPRTHKGAVSTAFGTDSETIFYTLGWTDDVKKVLGELTGAFALVWHDTEDNAVRMVRNSERPLHIMKIKGKNTLVYASEKDMALWAIARAKGEVESHTVLPAGELWRFDLGSTGEKMIKPYIQHVNLRTPPTKGYYGSASKKQSGGGVSYNSAVKNHTPSGSKTTQSGQKPSSTSNKEAQKSKDNIIQLPDSRGDASRRRSDVVGDFLAGVGLDKDADLYSTVTRVQHTGRTHLVYGRCEIGTEDFETRLYVPSEVSKSIIENASDFGGEAVSFGRDDNGKPFVILKQNCCWVVDDNWLPIFIRNADDLTVGGMEQLSGRTYWEERERVEEQARKRLQDSILEKHGLGGEDSELGESFDDDVPFDDDPGRVSDMIMGPNHSYVSKEEFKHLTKDGCILCHTPILEAEAELVEWEDSESPVCHHCQGGALQ